MNVAILSRAVYPYHGYGGLERHVYHLSKHLARKGVRVHLFVPPPRARSGMRPASDLAASISVHFVDCFQIPLRNIRHTTILDRITNYPWLSYQMGKKVRDLVVKSEIDIVHAHGLAAFGYAFQRGRRCGLRAPLIMNPHGMEEFKTTDLAKRLAYVYFRAMQRYGARAADRVIATDESMVEEVIKYLEVSRQKIAVLPNGVDIEECLSLIDHDQKRGLQQRFSLGGKGPIFLSVGRLEKNKGFDLLAEALGQIRGGLPDSWVWVLVGDGSQREAIARKVQVLGLQGNVRLPRSVDDGTLHNLYELADLFVHPTLYEGSSIAVLEAMAHQRAIVASTVGGIPAKVIPSVNGYLCRPGDVRDLGDKILACIADKAALKRMGEVSFRLVRERFSWSKVARETIEEYERLLQ